MKTLLITACSLSLLTPINIAFAQESPVRKKSGPVLVNSFAATVNGDVITLNELMIKVAPLQSVLMARSPRRGPEFDRQLQQLKEEILAELIDRTIIYTEFKDRINSLPDREIEAEVQRIIQNVYDGDEERFRAYLKATGLTRAQFKEQQRKELLVQIVRSQQFGDVPPPTDAELKKEYVTWKKQNRDRSKDVATYNRIYLSKRSGDGPEAQLQLAEDLTEKITAGADFAEFAKKYSDDSHADEGGLWKDTPRPDLNAEFGYLLFESKGNEVMGPIEDNWGYNIIQVKKRDFGPPSKSFSKAEEELKRRITSEKKKANFEKWMKKMRARAVIKKMI